MSVAASGLLAFQIAPASAASAGLVISEVYGGGGNTGATLTNDFIELSNPTDTDISVDGWSVQYRSASGTSAQVTNLTGTVPAGGHYLVQEAAGSGGSQALPTPDATGSIAMSGSNGQVFLVDSTDPVAADVTGDVKGSAAFVDMVGYGSAATYETAATGALSATTSAQRTAADADDNSTEFTLAAPDPQSSGSTGGGGGGDTEPQSVTIAEIQGTDTDTSPLAGSDVVTEGVVTAAYPTGGFKGFNLQTEGTGAGDDATPGASDGIFVYAPSIATLPEVGDSVQVTGAVSEYNGLTELTASDVSATDAPLDPVTALETAWFTTDEEREAHESELVSLTDDFTVTNSYATWQYGEIGLATGDHPLIQPTEVEDFQTGDIAGVEADNAARLLTLDDGRSANFGGAASDEPSSWVDADHAVRVGAAATLKQPMVIDYRFGLWRVQPTAPIEGLGTDVATFEDTRADNQAPADVGGDIRLATFNVLNYFPTTGEEYVDSGLGTCTYYDDRDGNHITTNSCTNNGPRGAADDANFTRQQAKIVDAINKLSASIVSLEEIENSVQFGKDRDFALANLVDALNAAAGPDTWAYVPSPDASALPALADQDVIRTAFIYKPAAVEPVGDSEVLVDETNFDNAREPLAQAFKAAGGADSDAFGVIVNHFKSKGSSGASGDNADQGQGAYNADRIGQAQALSDFASTFKSDRGIKALFLTGDFNAYSEEDPVQVLEDDGYTAIESDTAGEETYSFSGLSGSLDHVFANNAAMKMVTGADVWNINSAETVAFQYSRYNNNVTDFYAADPFAASDHDPEIVGVNLADTSNQVTLNLLGVNDFHGRINKSTVSWAGTVEKLTRSGGGDDSTLFIGAGDLIGASEFASAIDDDQPTIDVLNALELDASAVGNHEFDKGWIDLRDRVIGAEGSRNALWDYLGANVYEKGTENPVLPEFALFDVDGVTVGVIGVVTEETSSLVSPDGIKDIDFGNATDAVNRVAAKLHDGDESNGEADVIVASYHAGANQGDKTYEENLAQGGEFAEMASVDPAVDVIFNGHTHQTYVYDQPTADGTRPMIQTGSYAANVGQVRLTVDSTTGEVVSYEARNVPRRTDRTDDELAATYPRVAKVKEIVDAALAHAAEVGNQPVAEITDDITTAFNGGKRDDRSAESTLGDLVGNALRDGLDFGDPDLGLTNPGGLRAELLYAGDTSENEQNTDGVVTYAEANSVLPFGNSIALVDLTGAQLKSVLEEQWQPAGASRPYLQLGMSDNVEVTADASKPVGERITSVMIDGQPLDPDATYTVSTFNFLASGGDNFTSFQDGKVTDTGLLDADLWRDYLADSSPIDPDYARQQVFESGLPAEMTPGQGYSFTLGTDLDTPLAPTTGETLDLTSLGSPANTEVTATLVDGDDSTELGTFAVDAGTAQVDLDVPGDAPAGSVVEMVAAPSGTTVTVPVASTTPDKPTPTLTVLTRPTHVVKGKTHLLVYVAVDAGDVTPSGVVRINPPGEGYRQVPIGENGTVLVRLNKVFNRTGEKTIHILYKKDPNTTNARTATTIQVYKK
ncbi:ExeM/NucH family extracellular endonuclease [Nocardioides acrostichi]|uniref:ExeM/NucH family extracellular endonuclease n=1 Tax=Nocardioides acrostichi TaxID=2784339 RepID=A0A930V215_9ACTN|nr:ExeM/NucH family extracellular endonuclease [Nocardioides acrostichi]MBF4162285.1 ExeM/NucH family extracellular endonuclease [Nocardioides acrostichi]